jgi:hypothetical protein
MKERRGEKKTDLCGVHERLVQVEDERQLLGCREALRRALGITLRHLPCAVCVSVRAWPSSKKT